MTTSADTDLRRQTRTLTLGPGLYVVRFLCRAAGETPAATLAPADGCPEGAVEIAGPRVAGTVTLERFGDLAGVHVRGAGAGLAIGVMLPPGFPDRAVDINVERVEPVPDGLAARGSEDSLVRVSGHVERAGDRGAAPGGWLGDPTGRARVEGFAIHWPDRPADVELSYSCEVAELGALPAAGPGEFVGTRRRALPIRALRVDLAGPGAAGYALRVDAAFARAGRLSAPAGRDLRGAGATDHLTALRVVATPRRPGSEINPPEMNV